MIINFGRSYVRIKPREEWIMGHKHSRSWRGVADPTKYKYVMGTKSEMRSCSIAPAVAVQ